MDNAASERRGATTRLGSFEIVRKLARGGMAEIFLARTRGPSGFEKLVVLKKILPKYADRPRFVQLFLEEAKLAASLDHPNIAQVYDIGMVDGSYFFTMEYLHGQDVRSILQRAWRTGARFAIEHAVQVARNVASALHFAHEKQGSDGALLGIVHRDVSPSNIIVTYDGATKLLDFGVAKTAASTVKTRTGALKGKVSYMSPEQARGAPLDRRSDIFSLGVVLWEMVTTQRLFRGENDLATLQLIIHQPPRPPSAVRPDCPPELERIVLRALAQDPADRYATADELGAELDELAREHKLKQSASALSAALSQLFSAELAAWREARAAGLPLADHIGAVGDLTTPVPEADLLGPDASADELSDPEDADEPDDLDDFDDFDDEDAAMAGGPGDALAPLYRDENDEDDNELTEHLPVFDARVGVVRRAVPTPPSGAVAVGPRATPGAPFAPVSAPGPRATPGVPFASVPAARAAVDSSSSAPTAPFVPVGLADPSSSVPTAPHAAVTEPVAVPMLRGVASGDSRGIAQPHAHAAQAVALDAAAQVDDPSDPTLLAPTSPISITPTLLGPPIVTPAGTGAIPRAATNGPFAGVPPLASPPYAVPPWQSGQPSGSPDAAARSWAIVELPAVDPALVARQRRIVARIAGALIAFIVILAILAGHC